MSTFPFVKTWVPSETWSCLHETEAGSGLETPERGLARRKATPRRRLRRSSAHRQGSEYFSTTAFPNEFDPFRQSWHDLAGL